MPLPPPPLLKGTMARMPFTEVCCSARDYVRNKRKRVEALKENDGVHTEDEREREREGREIDDGWKRDRK